MRRFYATRDQFTETQVTLDEDEARHARDVLRLKAGDEINVFDGEGREYLCRIEGVGKRSADLSIIQEVEPSAPESPIGLTLAAAILKGDKTDLVVQKAVELGVTRFVPLIAARCEARFKDAGKRLIRWQRIALDAAKQCGRARLMAVELPMPVAEFLGAADSGTRLFFSERDGLPFGGIEADKKITAVVGPEGGWDDSEIRAAHDGGFRVLTFGGRILRADTAAVAITAILQHHFGDLS